MSKQAHNLPIKNLESLDLPSSFRKEYKLRYVYDKKTELRTVTVWFLIFLMIVTFGVTASMSKDDTELTSPSIQDIILTAKSELRWQLRMKGMLLGECGIFWCSKRWNELMDAEFIRVFGR